LDLLSDLKGLASRFSEIRGGPSSTKSDTNKDVSIEINELCGLFLRWIKLNDSCSEEKTRQTIVTLGSIFICHAPVVNPQVAREIVVLLRDIVVKLIETLRASENALPHSAKVICTCLRALNQIIIGCPFVLFSSQGKDRIEVDLLTNLVDALHWCFFRVSTCQWLSATTFRTRVRPTALIPRGYRGATRSFQSSNFQSKSYSKERGSTPESLKSTYSESEFSQISDMDRTGSSNASTSLKMRLCSLGLLCTIVRTSGKHFFSHWDKWLSVGHGSDEDALLLHTILNDASPRIRILSLSVLDAMVSGSKVYFHVMPGNPNVAARASSPVRNVKQKNPASYMSHSERLDLLVQNIHSAILDCFQKEPNEVELAQLIKVPEEFVSCSFFARSNFEV
jgi:hypothetical protein